MAKGNGSGQSVIEALIEAQEEMLDAVKELAAATKVTAQKAGKLEGSVVRMGRLLTVVGDTLQDHESRLAALESR